MDGMGGMGMWMLVWGVLALVVLALAVVGEVWVVRELAGRSGPSAATRESPEETLRQRYASGEIDEDEYQRRRRDLREG